jgi:glycosyltransferase involved in cell wall biosynthesis
MAPRVSIIITSYNYARYVGRTIDSALAQTYRNIEVVVVDDGSTDSSPDVIRGYGDRVQALFRQNGGQAAAQNAGFAASTGDIVLILDSDDYLYPDAIEAVVKAWRPDTTKAQFYLDAVDGAGAALGFRLPNIPMGSDSGAMSLIEHYGYYPSPPTSGNAYARSFLERVLPMCESTWKRGPDGLLNALAALYGGIVSIPRPLGAYRIHGRNMYAGAIDVAVLRANMKNELDREVEIKTHARRIGRPIDGELCLAIPAHCKARLVSLKLDPARHTPADDKALRLALAGVRASWRFPHLSTRKRVLATLVFPLLAVAPRPLLERCLEPLFRDTKRSLRSALRAMLRVTDLRVRGPVFLIGALALTF